MYGDTAVLPKHEDLPTNPLSPYAASKLAAEAYATAYAASYDLPVLAFRFFNVFGPLQPAHHAYAAVIPAFVAAALAGQPLPIYGDGAQTRDFTSVHTVCAVLTRALVEGVTAPGPVNLAFGSRRSLLEVVAELEAVLGHPLAREHGPARVGDVTHSQADPSRLERLFPGLQAADFRESLADTVRWARSRPPRRPRRTRSQTTAGSSGRPERSDAPAPARPGRRAAGGGGHAQRGPHRADHPVALVVVHPRPRRQAHAGGEQRRGDVAADHPAAGVHRLQVHRLPDRPGLDVLRVQLRAQLRGRRADLRGVHA